jgi:hypothetical protein
MRRMLSTIIALGLFFAAGMATVIAQEATPAADSDVELLFVQTHSAATISPSEDDPSLLTLTLEQGTGETIFLSDRPDRLAGSIKTDQFIDGFRTETAQDPANAALVVNVSESEEEVYVVELLEMEYNEASGTVTYTVRILADPSELDLGFRTEPRQSVTTEETYGTNTLFIDGGGLMQLVAYGAQD